MKNEYIELLLNKFYSGETSPQEEEQLTEFFRQENLPEKWDKDKEMILALSDYAPEVPQQLEQKMSAFIDSLEKSSSVNKKTYPIRKLWYSIASIAAVALLVIGLGIWNSSPKKTNKQLLADTFQTPDEAQEATIEALQLFAHHFSKGIEPLKKAEQQIEETQKIVQRSFTKSRIK